MGRIRQAKKIGKALRILKVLHSLNQLRVMFDALATSLIRLFWMVCMLCDIAAALHILDAVLYICGRHSIRLRPGIGIGAGCAECYAVTADYGFNNCKSGCLLGWCKSGCLSDTVTTQASLPVCTGFHVQTATLCLEAADGRYPFQVIRMCFNLSLRAESEFLRIGKSRGDAQGDDDFKPEVIQEQ